MSRDVTNDHMILQMLGSRLCVWAFIVWLAVEWRPSCGSGDVENATAGSGYGNSTEPLDVWPGLYGVIAASSVIVTAVTTLVCTVMILVHVIKVSPNKMVYTLREVLPGPEEVEKILEAEEEEEEDEESIPLQDGRLLLTGTSEETDV